MSKVLQERGFGSLPSSTKPNPRDQVKSILTNIETDSHSIRRIGSTQYAVSTGQNNTLLYKSRQMTVPFPSRLDNYYCEDEEGNYRPKFIESYGASHINNAIPQKEKDPWILEDMDAYRDEGMGDVIFGEPFLREVGIKTKCFEGIITLCNGDDEVTYQMVRSHPRFKRQTNERCNKIPPLLMVSKEYKKNGISHAYQKLKG
ncbi:hypothetical protein Tco_1165079 [Tanacetum coccineum]